MFNLRQDKKEKESEREKKGEEKNQCKKKSGRNESALCLSLSASGYVRTYVSSVVYERHALSRHPAPSPADSFMTGGSGRSGLLHAVKWVKRCLMPFPIVFSKREQNVRKERERGGEALEGA